MEHSRNRRQETVILVMAFWATQAIQAAEFAGGTGEPNSPYQVATAEQLTSIGSDSSLLDRHFFLLNDIDLDPDLPGGRVFTQAVIAPNMNNSDSFEGVLFTGSFDGGGHRISNLTIYKDAGRYLSLFGCIGKEAVVRDLRIEDACVGGEGAMHVGTMAGANYGHVWRCHAKARVQGQERVGVLVGTNVGDIIGCSADGEVVASMNAGGLAGANYRGLILNCHAAGDVSAIRGNSLGGLVGRNDLDAVIAHCYATGDVSVEAGEPNKLGGLVGNLQDGSINNCHAHGNVSGGDDCNSLGGLVGETWGYVSDSYSTGRVSPGKIGEDIGGLVGRRIGGEITGSFWDVETSGLLQSAGGTGLSTVQMQEIDIFLAAGWDWADERANGTADLWFLPEEGGYPMLTVHSDAFQPRNLDGNGTADDPYRIASAEDLGTINHNDPAACYRLDANVDLGGIAWNKAPIQCFVGWFDGNGKVVSGLKIRGNTHLGLFAYLGKNASVESLGIQDASITGRDILGLLAGKNKGWIRACRASGSIFGDSLIPDTTTLGGSSVGGLTAQNEGTIDDSYAAGDLVANWTFDVGGLTGSNCGTISRCYAAAQISWRVLFVPNCGGGLVGVNRLLGRAGSIQDSYFLMKTDGGGPANGLGTPLTKAQMKQRTSFTGWDFGNVWMICEGNDYPWLRWERIDCNTP